MVNNKWVVNKISGEFKYGGFYDPTIKEINDSIAILPTEGMPNIRTQKWDGIKIVDKTKDEIAKYDDKILHEQATVSCDIVVLTTIAWSIRFKDPLAWNSLSDEKKQEIITNEFQEWINLYSFVDKAFQKLEKK